MLSHAKIFSLRTLILDNHENLYQINCLTFLEGKLPVGCPGRLLLKTSQENQFLGNWDNFSNKTRIPLTVSKIQVLLPLLI